MEKERIYTVVEPDGTARKETVNGKATLKQLQAWVGGYIQGVKITGRQYAFVNEEGLVYQLPVNKTYPALVGPVVLCPEGCTT